MSGLSDPPVRYSPTCHRCGAVVPPGMLFAHVQAEHPVVGPAAGPLRACRKPACVDLNMGKHYHDPVRGVVR